MRCHIIEILRGRTLLIFVYLLVVITIIQTLPALNRFQPDSVAFSGKKNESILLSADEVIERSSYNTEKYSESSNSGVLKEMHGFSSIAVFYNLYIAKQSDVSRVSGIVQEQFSLLRPEHKEVYVRSIGTPMNIPNTTLLLHDEKGSEMETLASIYLYCQGPEKDEREVVYLHSKGSFHQGKKQNDLRQFITRAALSAKCSNMDPSMCNVCSGRMSPIPHPHTSGNMWSARCDYITKLLHPTQFQHKMDTITFPIGNEIINIAAAVGNKRFAAEHWIMSHPSVLPCDLYKDESFTWGSENVPATNYEKDLRPAPRFSWKPYVCKYGWENYGYHLERRLYEYQYLYGEGVSTSWWGWDFFNKMKEEHVIGEKSIC